MGMRLRRKNQYVYAIVGDGELNEGQCWEALQFIAHYKLHNCIVMIDDNKKQLDGNTKDIMNPFDFVKKMEAFGFKVWKVKGDDEQAIDEAIIQAKQVKDQAVCIVLDTIKGQGVPYFENLIDNHSVKYNSQEMIEENHKAIYELQSYLERRIQYVHISK